MSQIDSVKKTRTFQHINQIQRGKIELLIEQRVPKTQIAKKMSDLILQLVVGEFSRF